MDRLVDLDLDLDLDLDPTNIVSAGQGLTQSYFFNILRID